MSGGLTPARRWWCQPRRSGSRASQGRASIRRLRRGAVDPLLQPLARLECEHPARRDLDGLARLGITSAPRRLLPNAKVPEAHDLDVFAPLEAPEDDVEDGLDHR